MTNDHRKATYDQGFQIRGFGYTLDASPPAEGTMLVTYNNCTYDMGTRGAKAVLGFGRGSEADPRNNPTYDFVYTGCHVIDSAGVSRLYDAQ